MKHLLLAAMVGFSSTQNYCETVSSGSKNEVQLAECLAEKSTFYGAYFCDYCTDQKKELGPEGWEAYKKSYVECSDKSSKEELQRCEQEKITALPTWKFKDGKTETIVGYKSIDEIAGIAGRK